MRERRGEDSTLTRRHAACDAPCAARRSAARCGRARGAPAATGRPWPSSLRRRRSRQPRSAPASRVPASARCAHAGLIQPACSGYAPARGPLRIAGASPIPVRATPHRFVAPLSHALTGLWRPADITRDYAKCGTCVPHLSHRCARRVIRRYVSGPQRVRALPRCAAPGGALPARPARATRVCAPSMACASCGLPPLRMGCMPRLRPRCRHAPVSRTAVGSGPDRPCDTTP